MTLDEQTEGATHEEGWLMNDQCLWPGLGDAECSFHWYWYVLLVSVTSYLSPHMSSVTSSVTSLVTTHIICYLTYCHPQIPDHRGEGDSAREQLKVREFTFDHSFWSLDENDSHFVSQEQVRLINCIMCEQRDRSLSVICCNNMTVNIKMNVFNFRETYIMLLSILGYKRK